MPVEIINLQKKVGIDPAIDPITVLALEALRISKNNISVIFVNDRRMRELNTQFRNKRKTTDVLSFSYPKEVSFQGMSAPDGEIVISMPKAQKQAIDAGIPLFDELINLLIHGLCHLKGYDHESGKEDAMIMKKAERKIAKHIEKNADRWEKEKQDNARTGSIGKNSTMRFKGKIPDAN